jgi:two-component system LytT family response regulator
VLLTAHVEHALTAYDLGVRDYLLKPVSATRLHRCLKHIRPLLVARTDRETIAPARIAIRCGNGHTLVDPLRTIRVDAAGNFSVVHEDGREFFASETMKELERRLAPFGFLRIHKSHLVNRRFIRTISAADLQLVNGSVVPVGRAYRAALADACATD